MAEKDATIGALHRKLITGNHILHHTNVLDAYGHLSVRHPVNPEVFIMSRSIAPGVISSPKDLIEYYVANADPVDPTGPKGYQERHIHSEIYKRHAVVTAVIHSHADSVIPYTISGVPLRPCYHMGGFLGLGNHGSPEVYDAAQWVRQGEDIPDMLVRNAHLGEPLAKCFDGGAVVALMRGHGFTVVGRGVEEAVSRAVYTMKNAAIQTTATGLAFAAGTPLHMKVDGVFLTQDEAAAATQMLTNSAERPWGLWEREVKACGLYTNSA